MHKKGRKYKEKDCAFGWVHKMQKKPKNTEEKNELCEKKLHKILLLSLQICLGLGKVICYNGMEEGDLSGFWAALAWTRVLHWRK